jgi:hypothetical protein
MKAFIKANGGQLAVMTVVISCAMWVMNGMAELRIDQAKESQRQSEKFYSMLEKISEIDKSSLIRDNNLEILISKK